LADWRRLSAALRARARATRIAVREQPAESPLQPASLQVDYDRIEAMVRQVAEEVYQRRWSMPHLLRTASAAESAAFVRDNIPLHLSKGHYELRRDAVLEAHEHGLFLEFGVWQGSWLRQMAAVRDVRFYGFDSFEGLPEPWSVFDKGYFDLAGQLPPMPANVDLVKGWFDETLPAFLERHPEPVSFVHVDCDLYSSTKTVLDLIGPRFVPGTQIVLDDFMLEPGWQREEHRAFFEFIDRTDWAFEYTGYSADTPSCSAAVRLDERRV
jgi:hypothetical protein